MDKVWFALRGLYWLSQLILLATVFAILVGNPARAAEDPRHFIESMAGEATAMLADEALEPAERRAGFRELLVRRFDVPVISRFVLGRHWKRSSEAQRADFRALFQYYVAATYGRYLEDYAGTSLRVGRSTDRGKRGTFVDSQIRLPSGSVFVVVWRLRPVGGSWRVVDVVVEGVSMALTHRAEVDSVITHGGGRIEAVLARMRDVIAETTRHEDRGPAGAAEVAAPATVAGAVLPYAE